MTTQPIIGFAGLTHLGLNSAVAAAAKGFQVVGFHEDLELVQKLRKGEPPILEPQLPELMREHHERLTFSAETSCLSACQIVYIAVDVPTDDQGVSDLSPIEKMIQRAASAMKQDALLVILCQVPPGFTRTITWPAERLYYQVETLIFGRAIERAMFPERFIVGCANPGQSLNPKLSEYLQAFGCPILPMRYESAELAKISINMCLVASVSTANTLAEICEHIGADWSEIVPALRLDKRIGQSAYLTPGLGISGGNLERDLATILSYAQKHHTDGGVVSAWVANSRYRKEWAWRTLNELVLSCQVNPKIAVLGLTYKENTHSIKNSPSIALLERLNSYPIKAYDPAADLHVTGKNVERVESAITAMEQADVLLVMTPWPEFRSIEVQELAKTMTGKIVIDPYKILDGKGLVEKGFTYATLGEPVR
ncbi:nucleotide sugar dehydrogenase [Deltaproteobacteria bacterium TL4]